MCGRKREWREPDFSLLGVWVPLVSSECLRVSALLMRKKFLMRCETWPSLALTDLLVDSGLPEKVRFSAMVELVDDCEEPKSCVIAEGRGRRAGGRHRGAVAVTVTVTVVVVVVDRWLW